MRRLFLAIILLFSLSFSQACTPVNISLLAVLGDSSNHSSGGIINAHILPVADRGSSIFIDVSTTKYDKNLQTSLQDSYNAAEKVAGERGLAANCSALVSFNGNQEELGGPSGGLMFSLGFYELLTGEDLNLSSYGITGAIDKSGNVYPVGGILEKAEAALKKKDKLIIPITDRFDYILLKRFFSLDKVYFASTIEDALSILRGGSGVDPVPYLFPTNGVKVEGNSTLAYDFSPYYGALRSDYVNALNNVKGDIPKEATTFYEGLLNNADKEYSHGYDYTASNDLFLATSELMALDGIINNRDVKARAKSCLSTLEFPQPNYNNFEYIAGAKFRALRAYGMLSKASEDSTISSKAYTIRGYAESYEWCQFAKQLLSKASSLEGPLLDQKVLKEKATSYLLKLNEDSLTGPALDYYKLGLVSAAKGDYLTSLYYVAYLKAELSEAPNITSYNSFWGRVFKSHADFLNDSTTLLLANNLEANYNTINSYNIVSLESLVPKKQDPTNIALLELLLITLLLFGGRPWKSKA
ncbi:MAG: hypothetical protein D6769_01395 [Methanobacteriota archaeon]|nr:MAG: hypothetical protein D6769_01395 [Euryarchaeota archaeon]